MINLRNIRNVYCRAKCFGCTLQAYNILLFIGARFLPASLCKNIATRKDNIIRKKLRDILLNQQLKDDYSEVKAMCSHNLPIWFCWLQGEDSMPSIPRLCLESVRKNANEHPIIILTLSNYREYVHIPAHIESLYHHNKITNAHFSDVIRVNLLYQQGGFWIDSTILVTHNLDKCIFELPFFTIKTQPEGNYVSKCRWASFCMAASPGNLLMGILSQIYEIYWSKYNCIIDYLLMDYMFEYLYEYDTQIRKMIDAVPYNNENVHKLAKSLCEEYADGQLKQLYADGYLFKLSWKLYSDEELDANSSNFYHYFLEQNYK